MSLRSNAAAGRDDANRLSLGEAFATPEHKRRYNARLFDTIAPRYDCITRLLSYGRDQAWKARLIALAAIAPGETVLDLACGTGDLGVAAAARGAHVTGLDLVPRMIALARQRPDAAPIRLVVGDMTSLPIADASFDVITTGYGLRNVPRLDRTLDEIARVLKPGGRFLSLDFNRPDGALLRSAYLSYLTIVGSIVGVALHGDPDTYRYIAASLARYPGADAIVGELQRRGFAEARWVPALGGLMALHVATR
jgi:demethylmenaquinone methyltransferase / 2-methoxy-6-polyprenyl-1,4-benzoquinol methylase